MIGGLTKTTSRFAIAAAAAGVIMGGVALSPAQAADLGGDCCADLEERVAELEATTARKGNRKVSLTISGQVNKAVMFWDDGFESNAYVVDPNNSSTRWRFSGSAQIDPDWSAGFLIENEQGDNNSSAVNQNYLVSQNTDFRNRQAHWWLRSKKWGQLTVGFQDDAAESISEINLGGSMVHAGSRQHFSGGFFLRDKNNTIYDGAGGFSRLTWGDIRPGYGGQTIDGGRGHHVRYDTPSLHGFVASASWGEDDQWSVALRYAKEWNSIRVAAGIGYSEVTFVGQDNDCAGVNSATPTGTHTTHECSLLSGSVSVMHTPSGIFVSAAAGESENDGRRTTPGLIPFVNNGGVIDETGDFWYIQAGVTRKWHSLGNTTFYGIYYESDTGTGAMAGGGAGVRGILATHGGAFAGTAVVTNANTEMWGLGAVQVIDAAAMELYVHYRHYEAEVDVANRANPAITRRLNLEDFDTVVTGARIRF